MKNAIYVELAATSGIDLSKDYLTLSTAEVQRVIDLANFVKYRKPKQANGSRGRYFFAYLQRLQRKGGQR